MLLLVLCLARCHPDRTASTTYQHQTPVNEARMNLYASLNPDPELLHQFTKGITNDYHDMLQNQAKYFISKGISSTKLDLAHQVVLGKHVTLKNVPYSYSSLDDQTPDPRLQFTADYNEMLTNPDKKFMVIGIHPELSTSETRTLQNQMEDPIFVPSAEEIQE